MCGERGGLVVVGVKQFITQYDQLSDELGGGG